MNKSKLIRLYLFDCLLELLFKCKPLYKTFIRLDYFIRYGRTFSYLELTSDKNFIIRTNKWDTSKVAFYKRGWSQYEINE